MSLTAEEKTRLPEFVVVSINLESATSNASLDSFATIEDAEAAAIVSAAAGLTAVIHPASSVYQSEIVFGPY
jgi:hypothetical protein